jgi:hypothetical protein
MNGESIVLFQVLPFSSNARFIFRWGSRGFKIVGKKDSPRRSRGNTKERFNNGIGNTIFAWAGYSFRGKKTKEERIVCIGGFGMQIVA